MDVEERMKNIIYKHTNYYDMNRHINYFSGKTPIIIHILLTFQIVKLYCEHFDF